MDVKKQIESNRKALKFNWEDLGKVKSDAQLGKPMPELFKRSEGKEIVLDKEFPTIKQKTFTEVVASRRSLRKYREVTMSKEEVSYLLWETSSVRHHLPNATFRTIPTGGARNPMETYVYLQNIDGIETGLYHYIQDKHILVLLDDNENLQERVHRALYNQLRGANFTMIMTAIPYRSEFKYTFAAQKLVAMEAGHAGQNLSLAAEVIDCGACCIAAYKQKEIDKVLGVDGEEEFTTYAVTVGKR